jgi:hypothetical protein
MNIARGLLRLWVVGSFLWIAGTSWILWGELSGDCPQTPDANDLKVCELAREFGSKQLIWPEQ